MPRFQQSPYGYFGHGPSGGLARNSFLDAYEAHYYPYPAHSGLRRTAPTAPNGHARGGRKKSGRYRPHATTSMAPPAVNGHLPNGSATGRMQTREDPAIEITSYSGPAKRPQPLYTKRRKRVPTVEPTKHHQRPPNHPIQIHHENAYLDGIYGTYAVNEARHSHPGAPATSQLGNGLAGPYSLHPVFVPYTPSYSTHPPSTMPYSASSAPFRYFSEAVGNLGRRVGGVGAPSREERDEKARFIQERYPLIARLALKFAQLALGVAILGFVLGPMRGNDYDTFVTRTQTEWQGLVLGVAGVFAAFSLLLLASVFATNRWQCWRQSDALISALAALLYVLATSIEGYYAACYPPTGRRLNLVCHRPEWIIAAMLCFLNLVAYTTDLLLALRTGVNLL